MGTWDLRHYLVHNISVGQAVAVAGVFWPNFIEVDDCVFVEFLYNDGSYRRWRERHARDSRAIEAVMNELHLWDIFAPSTDEDYAALDYLAPKIADSWRAAMVSAFPSRHHVVESTIGPEDYGPTL